MLHQLVRICNLNNWFNIQKEGKIFPWKEKKITKLNIQEIQKHQIKNLNLMPVSESHSASKQKSKIKRTMGFASYWCNDLLKLFALFKGCENDILRINYIMQFLQSEECIADEMLNNKCLNSAYQNSLLIPNWFEDFLKEHQNFIFLWFHDNFLNISRLEIVEVWTLQCYYRRTLNPGLHTIWTYYLIQALLLLYS